MSRKKKLIVILGPTASGKTELSIKLAKKFDGEIVSADSRQIYKEMDIGTAKPSREELREIPHHLIDIVKPNQDFNAALYKKLALKKIKEIHKRKKMPFLVGGTGLYISAVVDNLEFPKIPPNRKLRKELEEKSTKELFEIYRKLDPEGAKYIDKNNKRRLIRAIEVCKISGIPFWRQRKKKKPLYEILQIGIKINKKKLEKKIAKRVNEMIKKGLEKEAEKLFKKYKNVPALDTIGYQEWKDYFNGKIKKEEVIEKIILHTKQYAKRQMAWFKRDKRIHWVKNFKEAERVLQNFLKK